MEKSVIEKLNEINQEFYAVYAESFSATRQNPWDGWNKCFEHIEGSFVGQKQPHIVDIACGNLRFEVFAKQHFGSDVKPSFTCVDSCLELLADDPYYNFVQSDILASLLNFGVLFADNIDEADLLVCFGFMHHVPSYSLRLLAIRRMLLMLKPDALACVSFWQFMKNAGMAEKATALRSSALLDLGLAEGDLERGDYFLGWQNSVEHYRYCHSFDQAEFEKIISDVSDLAIIVNRFDADGRGGELNHYIVFKRR